MTESPEVRSGAPVRRTSVGGIVLLVVGALLTMLGAGAVAGGAAAGTAVGDRTTGGWFTTPSAVFATGSNALTTPGVTELQGAGVPQLPFDIGSIRIRAASQRPVFIGIASRADAATYLTGVAHAEVTGVRYRPFQVDYVDVAGTRTPEAPATRTFWAASASGTQAQLTWRIRSGDWVVVVMNQDGSSGVAAQVQAGFRSELLAPVAAGIVATGAVLLLIGVPLLLLGTAAVGRTLQGELRPVVAAAPSPLRISGRVESPSRGLWLVKWLLAVPHYLVLALLWVAFLVTTIAAGVVVLFTGRYPRSWFAFDVGVLRWSWRVAFYGYSALGTDRYPPFSLGTDDGYPADLDVAYPEHLANGLVLVKWWLLVLPHALVLAALTGGSLVVPAAWPWVTGGSTGALSVLGVLVLVAGVLLLFTRRYPAGLFDLVLGIDRWAFRVAVYAALLTDDYPPFRLDQGPDEPAPLPGPPSPAETGAHAS